MSGPIQPTLISKTNLVGGGSDEMRIWLLSRKQFLAGTSFETEISPVWIDAGTSVSSRVHEPESVFGRYAMKLVDDSAAAWEAVYQRVDVGFPLDGRTFVASMWVKAIGADTGVDFQAQEITPALGAGQQLRALFPVTKDNWTFIVLVATFTAVSDATSRLFQLNIYPANQTGSPTDLGTIHVVAPRLYVARDELTGFPRYPFRDPRFSPFLATTPFRNAFGSMAYDQRGILPNLLARHPVANKSQIDVINAALQHDGILLVQPAIDSQFSFYAMPSTDEWGYDYIDGRAIGYKGEMTLDGFEPIFGITDAPRRFDSDSGFTISYPAFRLTEKP